MLTIRFDIEPDTKARFLFPSTDLSRPFRSLMWIKICSDGSLLTGPANQNIAQVRLGRPATTRTNSARETYGEGVIVGDEEGEDNVYLSFHASGEVNLHLAGQPTRKGPNLRSLDEPTQLCAWVFQSPELYPLVRAHEMNVRNAKNRHHDLPISLLPLSDHQLQAHIYVGPVDRTFPFRMESCSQRSRYILRCSGLKRMQDSFVVQLLFGQTDLPAPTRPETYILWGEASA